MPLIWFLSLMACEGDKLQSDTVIEEDTEWIEPADEHEPVPIIIEGVSIDCGDEYCHNDEVLTCEVALSETDLYTAFSWQTDSGDIIGTESIIDLSQASQNLMPSSLS